MQKKLIALAIAGLASGAAFAQTNVTVYGIADAAYMYSSGDVGYNKSTYGNPLVPAVKGNGSSTFSGIQSGQLSGSRLGFRGEEALGNGLKAVFTLEYSLGIDGNNGVGNTGSLNARQQFVGLSSDKLGTVALGRQYAPAYAAGIANDAFGAATFSPIVFLTTAANNSINPSSLARWDNAVTYTSPNFSGFTGKLIYAFGEQNVTDADTTDNGRWGIGGNYANGPLNLDLVYQSRQDTVTPATASSVTISAAGVPTFVPAVPANYNGNDINEFLVGGSYDFKMVKVFGTYQGQNDKNPANQDNDTWTLGAKIPVMAASNIIFSYGQTDWDQGNNGTMYNGKTQAIGLGWTTDMSKRTTVYAGYVYVDNDKDSAGVGINGVGAIGQSNQTFLSGIRHTF